MIFTEAKNVNFPTVLKMTQCQFKRDVKIYTYIIIKNKFLLILHIISYK